MDDAHRRALLTLTLTPGLGHILIQRCLDAFGSAQATLDASARDLAQIQRFGSAKASACVRAFRQIQADGTVERELETIHAHGVNLIARGQPGYPALLNHIHDPPILLWTRGQPTREQTLSLAIVGARRCTHYGREQADRFAGTLANHGLTIVSGGAYGIDAAAHRGVLRVGGRTVAVIGSGLANVYPRDHQAMFDEIVEQGGQILSEYPMTAAPKAENFPRRNRIISGLSLGTLVIEAALRSGALITARLCVEDHNRELMALPGRVDAQASAGCHKMIREGWATLVTSASDVLDQLGQAGQLLRADEPADTPAHEPGLSEVQRRIVSAMNDERSLDQLVALTGLPVQTVQTQLTLLEVRGTIARRGGLFAKRR